VKLIFEKLFEPKSIVR